MSAVPGGDPSLQLGVAFVNTYDLLETPPDALSVPRAAALARQFGFADLADRLAARDDGPSLDRLRSLRGRLYQVFSAGTPEATVDALNTALDRPALRMRAQLNPDGTVRIGAAYAGADADPVGELAALLTDAMAHAMAVGGPERFGTCAADPCRCAYVDRTRAGRQRFCCQLCNDRMAAAAYRTRRAAHGTP
jgi:predicted RNA-binding Zn ribbon-like protein